MSDVQGAGDWGGPMSYFKGAVPGFGGGGGAVQ